MKLKPNEKLDVEQLLTDLEHYRPKRHGWHWRKKTPNAHIGPFLFKQMSENLEQSIPLPAAKYFGNIDPQPDCCITT